MRRQAENRDEQGAALPSVDRKQLGEIIGRRLLPLTPSLQPLIERIALAVYHDVIVLLTGETGTGKAHLARLIHQSSPRKDGRFLTVPCGALAANLVESEFFGHAQGAFTGADQAREGKFAAEGSGTLFLDEIDALGFEQQVRLLRVIETGEFEPVGSNETHVCTGRIIVASNSDLKEAVELGRFRGDLYYRLNVLSLHLPPLRQRPQDVRPLVRSMVARFNQRFHKHVVDIKAETMAALEMFPWPGNVRELENVIQHAVLVSTGSELRLQHLPQPVRDNTLQGGRTRSPTSPDSLFRNRELAERIRIHQTLVTFRYDRGLAAASLCISRRALYKKMKKYGLLD
jgi:transcriptional regulator with PAS, ATPase and Fis domain